MAKKVTPKLPLTEEEREKLRKQKLKLGQIVDIEPETLAEILNVSSERARTLIALALYQRIPSVGPRLAQNVVDLGYYSLEGLQGADGAKLIEDLEQLYGAW